MNKLGIASIAVLLAAMALPSALAAKAVSTGAPLQMLMDIDALDGEITGNGNTDPMEFDEANDCVRSYNDNTGAFVGPCMLGGSGTKAQSWA
jgi:hypothetical protein